MGQRSAALYNKGTLGPTRIERLNSIPGCVTALRGSRSFSPGCWTRSRTGQVSRSASPRRPSAKLAAVGYPLWRCRCQLPWRTMFDTEGSLPAPGPLPEPSAAAEKLWRKRSSPAAWHGGF